MLPSLYIPGDKARAWSVIRAAALGAGLGTLAALFRTLSPLHQAMSNAPGWRVVEIAAAALGFALLCAGAAALRNVIARHLIWPELQ